MSIKAEQIQYVIDDLCSILQVSNEELSRMLGVGVRTLAYWKKGSDKRTKLMYRLFRLYMICYRVGGIRPKFFNTMALRAILASIITIKEGSVDGVTDEAGSVRLSLEEWIREYPKSFYWKSATKMAIVEFEKTLTTGYLRRKYTGGRIDLFPSAKILVRDKAKYNFYLGYLRSYCLSETQD